MKIERIVSKYTTLKTEKEQFYGRCPFCGTPDVFIVDVKKNTYFCFSCGNGGNVEEFSRKMEEKSAFTVLSKKRKYEKSEKQTLLNINRLASDYFHQILMNGENEGFEYLHDKRGIDEKTLTRFKLGWCSEENNLYEFLKEKGFSNAELIHSGLFFPSERNAKLLCKFNKRVMFPIFDENNLVVGFGGRVLDSSTPKYLNTQETEIFAKSSLLYGFNFAKKSLDPDFLICEGYMDVITLHQAGFKNAVAPMGITLTDIQARMMKLFKRSVKLLQDSDAAGMEAKKRAYRILKSKNIPVSVVNSLPAKDPDEFIRENGKKTMQKRLNDSSSFLSYEINNALKNCNKNQIAKYRETINEITDLLIEAV